MAATALWALLFVISISAEATTFHQTWEVKYDYRSPDKLNITVNRSSQAPTFFAEKNDIVILKVTNSLFTENLALHLIGVGQIGNPWLGATQYPTVPGETFIKEIVVDNPGKYFYDYYGILEREAAIYISIHVSDRKPEPSSHDQEESISQKSRLMLDSNGIIKKSRVAVRLQAENAGINYDYMPLAPPSPAAANRFSLKVIIWTSVPLIILAVVAFILRMICTCNGPTAEEVNNIQMSAGCWCKMTG